MTQSDRHITLDAIRGFAVMGILLLNIVGFSMPDAAYVNPAAWGGTDPLNAGVWAVNFVLFDGKMRGLFSVLFGASMLLVMQRAEAAGQNPRSVHLNRMAWLFVIGAAHFILLWWGDILVPYAICGTLALFFVNKDVKQLLRWAIILYVLYFLLSLVMAGGGWTQAMRAAAPGADAELVKASQEMLASFGKPGTEQIAESLDIYRSGWAEIMREHLSMFPESLINTLFFFTMDTLAMMLLGMAMLKSGFILGLWLPAPYKKIALRAFAIGIPPMIALAVWVMLSGYDTVITFAAFFSLSFPFRVVMTVGWAAGLLWLVVTHRDSPLIARVAAAGRAAFSNYLGTSLVMTFIFYGWGLGLFGQIDRATAMLFVFAAWGIMLIWSKPWLERYRFGPAEWLWRSLARRKLQPMRLR
ncbi:MULTISPECIES: DUF418 domain-containing protein [Pseudomonadota]|jgi:uncharacterized protein|uniref:DUF418 domain-containing protein n=1 Tax=Pseudomonadota TaxID=1224 RepID=UPI00076A18DA|nr:MULTISPECIES: DUF418 domain-containing protein [Pseudomonadota]MAF61831.1 DUF418 domain-containing protein [Blastomonas sp.]MBA4780255.1 DUF418 domain-containing protein [Blastomonas sp.]|tara:strand:- start:58440 stop:59678 length:1239 start_codon:yes stop_codon:yes gene_type:complete